jgi:hypothetical protein
MELSLAQAAEQVGVNRSTLLRAIKKGRVSGRRDDSGSYLVDASELARAFPPKPVVAPAQAAAQGDAATRIALAEARLAHAEAELAAERRRSEELRTERDEWREQAKRLALPPPVLALQRRGLFGWLRRAG